MSYFESGFGFHHNPDNISLAHHRTLPLGDPLHDTSLDELPSNGGPPPFNPPPFNPPPFNPTGVLPVNPIQLPGGLELDPLAPQTGVGSIPNRQNLETLGGFLHPPGTTGSTASGGGGVGAGPGFQRTSLPDGTPVNYNSRTGTYTFQDGSPVPDSAFVEPTGGGQFGKAFGEPGGQQWQVGPDGRIVAVGGTGGNSSNPVVSSRPDGAGGFWMERADGTISRVSGPSARSGSSGGGGNFGKPETFEQKMALANVVSKSSRETTNLNIADATERYGIVQAAIRATPTTTISEFGPERAEVERMLAQGRLDELLSQFEEAARARGFVGDQNELDRALQRFILGEQQGFTGAENEADRQLQTLLQGNSQNFTGEQNALNRNFQLQLQSGQFGENALDRGLVTGENALDRRQQELDRRLQAAGMLPELLNSAAPLGDIVDLLQSGGGNFGNAILGGNTALNDRNLLPAALALDAARAPISSPQIPGLTPPTASRPGVPSPTGQPPAPTTRQGLPTPTQEELPPHLRRDTTTGPGISMEEFQRRNAARIAGNAAPPPTVPGLPAPQAQTEGGGGLQVAEESPFGKNPALEQLMAAVAAAEDPTGKGDGREPSKLSRTSRRGERDRDPDRLPGPRIGDPFVLEQMLLSQQLNNFNRAKSRQNAGAPISAEQGATFGLGPSGGNVTGAAEAVARRNFIPPAPPPVVKTEVPTVRYQPPGSSAENPIPANSGGFIGPDDVALVGEGPGGDSPHQEFVIDTPGPGMFVVPPAATAAMQSGNVQRRDNGGFTDNGLPRPTVPTQTPRGNQPPDIAPPQVPGLPRPRQGIGREATVDTFSRAQQPTLGTPITGSLNDSPGGFRKPPGGIGGGGAFQQDRQQALLQGASVPGGFPRINPNTIPILPTPAPIFNQPGGGGPGPRVGRPEPTYRGQQQFPGRNTDGPTVGGGPLIPKPQPFFFGDGRTGSLNGNPGGFDKVLPVSGGGPIQQDRGGGSGFAPGGPSQEELRWLLRGAGPIQVPGGAGIGFPGQSPPRPFTDGGFQLAPTPALPAEINPNAPIPLPGAQPQVPGLPSPTSALDEVRRLRGEAALPSDFLGFQEAGFFNRPIAERDQILESLQTRFGLRGTDILDEIRRFALQGPGQLQIGA